MLRRHGIIGFLLLTALILCACQPLVLVEDNTLVTVESTDSEANDRAWDEIFVIGVENGSWSEFASYGFDEYQEYICQLNVDCTVADIPLGLYEGDGPSRYHDSVPRLTIVFQLERDYDDLVLRLARAGSETTAVFIDDSEEPLLVTSEMLGSRDGGTIGAYDLPLDPLQAGSHSVAFAIHNDDVGNGEYAWDALSLHAR